MVLDNFGAQLLASRRAQPNILAKHLNLKTAFKQAVFWQKAKDEEAERARGAAFRRQKYTTDVNANVQRENIASRERIAGISALSKAPTKLDIYKAALSEASKVFAPGSFGRSAKEQKEFYKAVKEIVIRNSLLSGIDPIGRILPGVYISKKDVDAFRKSPANVVQDVQSNSSANEEEAKALFDVDPYSYDF